MTTNQLKRLDAIIFFGSLAVMVMTLVLMGERIFNGNTETARFMSGLFSFFLMMMGHMLVSAYKRGFFWSEWRLTLPALFPEFDMFLFPSGKGAISELLPLESTPTQFSPGFIYIMRRSDGVYKFGKSTDPIRRQVEHIEDYEKGFEIIKLFAVSNMTVFEQLALRMTKQYFYRKEQGRKELRRMSRQQVADFIKEFERAIEREITK